MPSVLLTESLAVELGGGYFKYKGQELVITLMSVFMFILIYSTRTLAPGCEIISTVRSGTDIVA